MSEPASSFGRVVLGSVAGRQPLHGDREDASDSPVGVAARLFLDLAYEPPCFVARLSLDLLDQDLSRLVLRQARDPLELSNVLLPGLS